jgi:hypothetical protein
MGAVTLQRIAEAAGFAMVADEEAGEGGAARVTRQEPTPVPKAVLKPSLERKLATSAPTRLWERASIGSLLPSWGSKT